MLTTLIYRSHIRDDEPVKKIEEMVSIANRRNMQSDVTGILLFNGSHFFQLLEGPEELNRPGFPGECFICELRLPDHRFRWKHNKLFLLLPEEYGPAFPAIVDCYTSPPT